MKKIINGKRYDTDAATAVGEWYKNWADRLNRISETLYRKNNGEFFLYGEGGPMTAYAKWHGESVSGGEQITPMTYTEAQEWAEKHLDAEEYEKIFGEVVDDDTDTVFAVRLPASTVEKVKRAAYEAGVTISAYVDSKLNS